MGAEGGRSSDRRLAAGVDHVLKIETPNGPCWRRYNHDGYGQRKDGGPYEGWDRAGRGLC